MPRVAATHCYVHNENRVERNGKLRCLTCRRDSSRRWAAKQPHIRRSAAYELTEKRGHLRRKYNLTLERFESILAAQGGKCGSCGTTNPGKHTWHVDHDHACCPGKSCGRCVRGLLCGRCNIGIGMFEDSVSNLFDAQVYLTNSGQKLIGGKHPAFVLRKAA